MLWQKRKIVVLDAVFFVDMKQIVYKTKPRNRRIKNDDRERTKKQRRLSNTIKQDK